MKKKIPNQLSGAAGEFYVAAELMKRGIVAAPTGYNTKNYDIVAMNESGERAITIQVKTNQNKSKWFMLSEKNEDIFNDNLIYVFVNLDINNSSQSEYFIVPSKEVAITIKEKHIEWLETPGRNGRKHKPTTIRQFEPKQESYNNWGLIENMLT